MNNTVCNSEHRYDDLFVNLPFDQGRDGRHKCAGCAYVKGFQAGSKLDEKIDLDLENLPFSQAGNVRHKSPHAAFAMGYQAGVQHYYDNKL